VSGIWAGTEFAVFGLVGDSFADDATFGERIEITGSIRGRVGNDRIRLDTRSGTTSAAVDGEFAGPPAMALLMIIALLQFTRAIFQFDAATPAPTTEAQS
jgi:hypothetical protein